MALKISYDGQIIGTLSKNQTITLNCKNKLMTGNVIISCFKESSTNLITFHMSGLHTLQAEEGMTWAEFVESKYNTEKYYISESKVYPYNGYWLELNGITQTPTDVIVDGSFYVATNGFSND